MKLPFVGSGVQIKKPHVLVERGRVMECAAVRGFRVEPESRRAETADVGELVQVGEADLQRLAAAHRQPGDRAVFTVWDGAVRGVNERHEVLDDDVGEDAAASASSRAAPAAG